MPEPHAYSSVSKCKVPCWRSYVDLGPNYTTICDTVQCWRVCKCRRRRSTTALGISAFVLSLAGEALMGYCVFLWEEERDPELLTDSLKVRFMLIKKFSGASQLTSTVNKSVKPLLILTGCFSGKRLLIGKAYVRNKERMEGLQVQGERFDEKKSTSNVQRSLSLQKLTHH